MITKGVWTGHYDHSEKLKKIVSSLTATKFTIEILETIENRFSGTVQDDLLTGGTERIGEIDGIVESDKIKFIKRMPIMTLIVDKKGTRKVFNRKHRPIYYSGTFSGDKQTISGEWHFKIGIIWTGLLPRLIGGHGGTWTMTSRQ